MPRRNPKVIPAAQNALDKFKWEAAEELGLAEKAKTVGFENMTSKECGSIGGLMTKKMIRFAQANMAQANGQISGPTEEQADGQSAAQQILDDQANNPGNTKGGQPLLQ